MANKYIPILMLLSAVAPAWAQTGPGGVSATGTTTNLKLWLSSDRGVFTNAGTTPATNAQSVQQWNDFSGNATNATNANTASTRPTFVATAGNGRPALNFSPGSLQTLTAGLDIRPSVQPQITVIAVSRTAQTTSTPLAKLWGHDAPVAGSGFHRGIGFDNRATTAFTYFSGAGVGSYGTVPANSDFITSSNYTATTFNGFINGSQIVSNATVSQNGGATALSVGSLTPTSEFWNGTVSEFIVFNKSLSDAERRLVESYLAAKYAITITNDVYAMDEPANGNFDFDVAGIGAEAAGATVTSAQGSGILGVNVATAPVAGRYFVYGHDNGPLALAGSNQPPGTSSRLARIWAASELNGDVGSMNLGFDVSGIPGVPQTGFSDYRLIIDRNGNGSFSDESAATAGVIPASSRTGNVINFNGVNIGNAQRFTLAFTNTVALPLDLLSFRAAATGAQNKISWETANVRGVAGLELERSGDGVNFGLLERVSVNGTGRYTISDTRPEATSYYRLRIVDADGASSYGAIEKVLRGSLKDAVRIAPNPASDAINITGLPAAGATIRVSDAMGRMLTTARSSGASANISLATYAPGIYFVRIDAPGLQVAERISIVR